jgi:pimeloyl-ACP methyl ester carboxylesterase
VYQSIIIDGVEIAYEEEGAGPPVVFIHGFGAHSFAWRALRAHLPNGHRTISIDLKGFGRSTKPADGKYTIEDQTAIVAQLLHRLGLHQAMLVGHSFGGGVALALALREDLSNAGRLRGMVLIAPHAFPQQMPSFVKLLRAPVIGPLALRVISPRGLAFNILRVVYQDDSKITREQVQAYAQPLRSPEGREALINTARQLSAKQPTLRVERYPSIRLRTLVIWGGHDPVIPRRLGHMLVESLPNARLAVVRNCGHAPHEEQPAQTAALVADFLNHVHPTDE